MKVSVLQDKLNTALKQFRHVIDKKNLVPVLYNVVLYPEDATLVVGGTNLSQSLKMRIGAKVDQEGRGITLPYLTLSKLIDKLPAERIDISADYITQTATFVCNTRRFELKGIDADEFPALRDVEAQFEIMSDKLLTAMNKVSYAMCKQDNRPVLQCLSMMPVDGKLQFAAADGYRLAVSNVATYDDLLPEEPFQALIHIEDLPGMVDFIKWAAAGGNYKSKFPEMLKLAYVDDGQHKRLGIATLTASYWVNSFDSGKFPDYQVINKFSPSVEYTLNREDLIDAIDTSKVYYDHFTFDFDPEAQQVEIASGSPEHGVYHETLPAKGYGNLQVFYNSTMALETLNPYR